MCGRRPSGPPVGRLRAAPSPLCVHPCTLILCGVHRAAVPPHLALPMPISLSGGDFLQKKKALLIDDEVSIQTLVRLVLEGNGWQVLVSGEGLPGLALAREHIPDVILLDVALPDVSGLEVCRQLKADPTTRAIPVAMLTAFAQEGDRRVAMALGADDYIPKPWRPATLLAKIAGLMAKSHDSPSSFS